MPAPLVKKVAKLCGKSLKDVEALWDKAKKIAAKEVEPGSSRYWGYVTGVFKKSLGTSCANKAFEELFTGMDVAVSADDVLESLKEL